MTWWQNNRVAGSWTTWFLDFNKRGAWNKRGGAKFEPFLTNVVAEITKLWVENSHKINCRDVTSIREGRVFELYQGISLFYFIFCWNEISKKSSIKENTRRMGNFKANHIWDRSSHRRCSVRKDVFRNFAKFTGKNNCSVDFSAIKILAISKNT